MSAQLKYGFVFLLLISIPTTAFSIYKCVNEQGKTTFQETACPSNASQEITKSQPGSSPKSELVEHREFTSDEPMESSEAMLIRQKLASAISSLSYIKISVVEYYSSSGNWPKELSDIGFDSDGMNSGTINSVKIGANGDFAAELNDTLGDKKLIVFKPESVLGGSAIEWSCYANFTEKVLSFAGHSICKSSANPEISTVALNPPSHFSSNSNNEKKKDFLRPGERRMLEKYEERGKRLIEAKKKSVEDYRKRKEDEESEQKEANKEEPNPWEHNPGLLDRINNPELLDRINNPDHHDNGRLIDRLNNPNYSGSKGRTQ